MKNAFVIAVLVLVAFGVHANVPAPQYRAPGAKVTLVTNDDLSEYRIFLISGPDVRQVNILPGKSETIGLIGIDSGHEKGSFVAVPVKGLAAFPDSSAGVTSADAKRAIAEGRAAGMIKLFEHRFFGGSPRTTPDELAHNDYRIERRDGTIAAVPIAGAKVADGSDGEVLSIAIFGVVGLAIVGGVLMIVVVILIGIFVFRRSRRPS